MSEEKKVAIVLKQPPHGTLYPVEGLRMAVALSGDIEPIVVAVGDGVFTFLDTTDKTLYQTHFEFLKGLDIEIFADKQALEANGIATERIIEGVEVKEHAEIIDILISMDTVIPF